jgi:hypothetical protein
MLKGGSVGIVVGVVVADVVIAVVGVGAVS